MTTLTLLPELWLSLLHRAEDHVTRGGGGETVETSTGAVGLNHEEGLGAAVVRTVKDGTGGQTKGHAELLAGGTNNCISSCHELLPDETDPITRFVHTCKGSGCTVSTSPYVLLQPRDVPRFVAILWTVLRAC